jgi:diguanylate cyclase (GGDEF)-like protein
VYNARDTGEKAVHESDAYNGDYEALYRSYQMAREELEYLSTLREIGLAITSTLDLDETLTTIAHVVQGALEIRRLTIFTLEDAGKTAHPIIAKYGGDVISKERLEEERTPVAGSPMAEALDTRRVVLVNTEWQTAAYVPLISKNSAVGVMRIEDPVEKPQFTENDAHLFMSVGALTAIAINNAQLYAMAVTDGLTKLYVRRYFDLRMAEEFDQSRRYRRCFSLMMFDIDHFKKFNDTHGHQTGDLVLVQFAQLLRANTRRSDICCRYGGEEMAVVMPETRLSAAAMLAEKLCERIRSHEFSGSGGQKLSVTTSIGVSTYHEKLESADDLVGAADEALYRAKHEGRDRVAIAQS